MSLDCGPFPSLSLREVAETHCRPFPSCDPFLISKIAGHGKNLFTVTMEDMETYKKEAGWYKLQTSGEYQSTAKVTYYYMQCDKDGNETLLSIVTRYVLQSTAHFDIHNAATLFSYLTFHGKIYYSKSTTRGFLPQTLLQTTLNRQKLIDAIYEPLKALPDNFASKNARVWMAVEKLRCALPWECDEQTIGDLIDASELVQKAIKAAYVEADKQKRKKCRISEPKEDE